MRRSIFGLKSLVAIAALGLAGHLQAAPISLDNGSKVVATTRIDQVVPTQSVTDPVTSLPFLNHNTTSDTGKLGTSSNVLSNLTTSAFNFDFKFAVGEFISEGSIPFGFASGQGDMFFTGGDGVTFAISGFQTAFGDDTDQFMSVFLHDLTTDTFLYDYRKEKFVGQGTEAGSTITADSSGGSLTGSLIAGHHYEFNAYQELSNEEIDPTSNGTVNIAFAQTNPGPGPGPSVPLPAAFPAALLTVGIFGAKMRRRSHV